MESEHPSYVCVYLLKCNILFRSDLYCLALETCHGQSRLLDDDLKRELCLLFITVLPFVIEDPLLVSLARVYTGN